MEFGGVFEGVEWTLKWGLGPTLRAPHQIGPNRSSRGRRFETGPKSAGPEPGPNLVLTFKSLRQGLTRSGPNSGITRSGPNSDGPKSAGA